MFYLRSSWILLIFLRPNLEIARCAFVWLFYSFFARRGCWIDVFWLLYFPAALKNESRRLRFVLVRMRVTVSDFIIAMMNVTTAVIMIHPQRNRSHFCFYLMLYERGLTMGVGLFLFLDRLWIWIWVLFLRNLFLLIFLLWCLLFLLCFFWNLLLVSFLLLL